MTDTEVNKILAEFEDLKFKIISDTLVDKLGEELDYTKDLNLLVPIWEKLESGADTIHLCMHTYTNGKAAGFYEHGIWSGCKHFVKGLKTIKQAAAHSTAKAVVELRGLE